MIPRRPVRSLYCNLRHDRAIEERKRDRRRRGTPAAAVRPATGSGAVTEHKTLCVGIDVSSRHLKLACCDGWGVPVGRAHSFPNSPAGIAALCDAVVARAERIGPGLHVIAGLESTSDFHRPAAKALNAETRLSIEVHVLNPRRVKWFRHLELKDTKTDRVDAELIARFVAKIRPQPYAVVSQGCAELQEATRTRRRCMEERSRLKNRLHRLLRTYWPGWREAMSKHFGGRTLVALKACPSPHDARRRGASRIAQLRNCDGKRIGRVFAERFLARAKDVPSPQLPMMVRISIQDAADRILQLNSLLRRLDAAIAEELERVFPDNVLLSLPGLGPVSVASILAEIGDIRRFPTKEVFIGYCGLYPIAWESGDTKLRFCMTRKGNRMLKLSLLLASGPARQCNPALRHFYDRLRQQGKPTKAAGGAVARKLAEIVWVMLTRNDGWSEDIALRGIAKSELMTETQAGERRLTGDAAGQTPVARPIKAATRSRAPRPDSTKPPPASQAPNHRHRRARRLVAP
jgi:transposase